MRRIKPNRGIWWRLRRVEGDSEIHLFSLTQILELTGFSHTSDFSTLNLQNQIYTSKWYDNYNIALRCSMYRGLIFSLRSSNFFLPFTCLCPFFWSVVIPRSLPLWTWLFSSLGALCLFLSGSLFCLLDLLLGSASPLVLAPWSWSLGSGPWSWSFSSGPLVPLAQASCSTAAT